MWRAALVGGLALVVAGCSGGGFDEHGVSFDGPGDWDMHEQSPGPAGSAWYVTYTIPTGATDGVIYVVAYPQSGTLADVSQVSDAMNERAQRDNGSVTVAPHLLRVGSLAAAQMEWDAADHSAIYTVIAGSKAEYEIGCTYGDEEEVRAACNKLVHSFKET